MDIILKLKEELNVEKWQVEAAVKLIDEGNTIPFISRYRKEVAADPFYRTQQETACTYCKYLEACRFSDGENGECHRRLPKLPASRVWNYMEGGEQDG